MKFRPHHLAFSLLTIVLTLGIPVSPAFAAKERTFTGTVSDSMCGAKHMMEGDPAACARACLSKGSKYALVVGDQVYTLDTSDKAPLETLDKKIGAKVTVSGTEKDNVITVNSVKAAK
jgi:hypothetical protein